MPELPEVETLARDLRATVVGRKITKATVSPDAPRLVVQEMDRRWPLVGDRHDPPL